jgi:hypothetical protein
MKIYSSTTSAVIGASSQAFPIPPLPPNADVTTFLATLAVVNTGPEDCYVLTGPTPASVEVTSATGTHCPAGETTLITRNIGDTWVGAISASSTPTAIAVGLGA